MADAWDDRVMGCFASLRRRIDKVLSPDKIIVFNVWPSVGSGAPAFERAIVETMGEL